MSIHDRYALLNIAGLPAAMRAPRRARKQPKWKGAGK